MMRRRFAAVLIGGCCLGAVVVTPILTPSPRPAAAAPIPLAGPLHVSGTSILDSNGNNVILQGISWSGPEWDPKMEAQPTAADVAGAQQGWGFNTVRLELNEEFWNQACPVATDYSAATYRAAVDQAVQAIAGARMLAIIDLHHTVRGTCDNFAVSARGPFAGNQYPLPDKAGGEAFWSSVASTYAYNPSADPTQQPAQHFGLVAFELYNEPRPCTDAAGVQLFWNAGCNGGGNQSPVPNATSVDPWWNAGSYNGLTNITTNCTEAPVSSVTASGTVPATVSGAADEACPEATYTVAGMHDLYTVVRSAAPSNLILVDAPDAATDPSPFLNNSTPPMFPATNLVVAEHLYCAPSAASCENSSGQPDDTLACSNIHARANDFFENSMTGVNGNSAPYPIIVTEFGWPDATNGVYNAAAVHDILVNLRSSGVDGYTAYTWNNPAVANDLYALRKPGTNDPTPAGKPIQDALKGVYDSNC